MAETNFVVVGDTILDCFLYGDAVRISPEAPALVLDVREEKHSVGGVFNVFSHIKSLGGAAKLITVTGSDISKYHDDYPELIAHEKDIVLFKDISRVTSIKTRLVAYYKFSYLARFDKEVTKEISDTLVDKMLQSVSAHLNSHSSLLIVDYNKGVVTPTLARELIAMARNRHARVYVDTKRDDIERFTGAYLFKPNKVEFHEIKLRYQLSEKDDIEACLQLMERFSIDNVVLTLGARGMIAVDRQGEVTSVTGHNVAIKELSGAGDSVLAVLAYLVSQEYRLKEALEAANNVAARFISSGVLYRAKQEDLFSHDGR